MVWVARVGSQVSQSHARLRDFTINVVGNVWRMRSHAGLLSVCFGYRHLIKTESKTYFPF
jgi:hypothetical protein